MVLPALPFAIPSITSIVSGIGLGAIGARIASGLSLGGIRAALFGSTTRSVATGWSIGQLFGAGDVADAGGSLLRGDVKILVYLVAGLGAVLALGQLFTFQIGGDDG